VLHLEEKLTEDKEVKGQARWRSTAYDASVEEETRGGWSGLRVTRGEKEGRGARRCGGGGGGPAEARLRRKRVAIDDRGGHALGRGPIQGTTCGSCLACSRWAIVGWPRRTVTFSIYSKKFKRI
jgi:hypothetical protein